MRRLDEPHAISQEAALAALHIGATVHAPLLREAQWRAVTFAV